MKFQLTIDLDLSNTMRDSYDVARALRGVADHLSKFVSTNWSPYALSGKIKDDEGSAIGGWEVKGDFEWNPVVHDCTPKTKKTTAKPTRKRSRT